MSGNTAVTRSWTDGSERSIRGPERGSLQLSGPTAEDGAFSIEKVFKFMKDKLMVEKNSTPLPVHRIKVPISVKSLDNFGRIQLSKSFFMREFLYSEISQIEGIHNIPTDPDLAVAVGERLCQDVLEPIQDALGRISIRSAYRSRDVNDMGSNKKYNCAKSDSNRARHIWDERDVEGAGATACVLVTSYLPYFKDTGNWQALAWWIHDNIPAYSELEFFTKNPSALAFNISWHEKFPKKTIHAWAPTRVCLTKPGMNNHLGDHSHEYHAWRSKRQP